MARVIRLTESDFEKIIKRVLKEEEEMAADPATVVKKCIESNAPSIKVDTSKIPDACKNIVKKITEGGKPEPTDIATCTIYVGGQISSLGFEALTKGPAIIDCIQKGLK